ncbi:MAG: hypothetical protein MRJ96_15720 [Nitrospirales bacterium]|nr:hypothetical protein [Nitrospira sp.]MDR4502892.1 hypothetical protein [Nitrospirales bacterium]
MNTYRFSQSCMTGVLFILIAISVGCHGPSKPPISLNNLDPSQDQQFIVKQYLQQAVRLVQRAHDFNAKAERYAQLFGPDSEWTTSARMLENYYMKAAYEREHMAVGHVGLLPLKTSKVSLKTR